MWLIAVIVELGILAVYFVAMTRILNRMGFSGWWSLLIFVPIGNIIGLWQLSKARWPGVESQRLIDTF